MRRQLQAFEKHGMIARWRTDVLDVCAFCRWVALLFPDLLREGLALNNNNPVDSLHHRVPYPTVPLTIR